MNTKKSFSDSKYDDDIHRAERELSAFIGAVTELFGPEEARLSAEDWLDESESMDGPPRSDERDWRSVTVAASARLATRLNVGHTIMKGNDHIFTSYAVSSQKFKLCSSARLTDVLLTMKDNFSLE